MKTVKDVMSAHPISVQKNASLKEIAARFRELRVSALPVLADDGTVIGVLSEADLMAKQVLAEEQDHMRGRAASVMHRRELRKVDAITAGDLMTSPAVMAGSGDTVEHAARLMYASGLKLLPVTDAAGRLTGVVSRTDLLAVFDRSDDDIRVEITTQVIPRLSEPSWYWVTVQDGIVNLEGTPETAAIGRQVLAAVRRVQGVVAVRDRLAEAEPQVAAGSRAPLRYGLLPR